MIRCNASFVSFRLAFVMIIFLLRNIKWVSFIPQWSSAAKEVSLHGIFTVSFSPCFFSPHPSNILEVYNFFFFTLASSDLVLSLAFCLLPPFKCSYHLKYLSCVISRMFLSTYIISLIPLFWILSFMDISSKNPSLPP